MMFSTMWLKNFFGFKSLMGTPLDSNFCTHNFFFQLQVWADLAVQIKNFFSTIKDLPIWFFGNEGILVSQNSYGHTMIWSSFSSNFFVFARVDRKLIEIGNKSDSELLGRCKWFWLVQKSYGHGFFTCRPPSLWSRRRRRRVQMSIIRSL